MAKLFQSDRILQDSNSKFQEIAERRSQEEDSLLLNFEFAFFVRIITERGPNGITFVPYGSPYVKAFQHSEISRPPIHFFEYRPWLISRNFSFREGPPIILPEKVAVLGYHPNSAIHASFSSYSYFS